MVYALKINRNYCEVVIFFYTFAVGKIDSLTL